MEELEDKIDPWIIKEEPWKYDMDALWETSDK